MDFALAIGDAYLNPEKLAEAMISCGFLKVMAAIKLIIRKGPDGILLQHGMVLFCFSYAFLIATVMFGFFEIFAGFWVSEELVGRRAAGKKILQYSIVPLVLVLALVSAE